MCHVLLSLRTGGGRTGVQFRYHVLAAFWRKQQPTSPPLGPQSWKAQVSWVSLLAFLEGCWDACWCSSCRGQEHPSRGRVPATRLKTARTGSRRPQLMVKVKQCQEHRALRVTARAPRVTTTRMLARPLGLRRSRIRPRPHPRAPRAQGRLHRSRTARPQPRPRGWTETPNSQTQPSCTSRTGLERR